MDIKTRIRNISMIVGIAAISAVGLFFILFVDLYLRGDSGELFIGIILPLASVVLLILAESFKHKPVVFYIMKAAAILFAIGFIIYAFSFMSSETFENTKTFFKLTRTYDGKKVFFLNSEKFNDGIDIPFNKVPMYVTMIVVAFIGTIGTAVNTAANAVVGLD